MVCTHIKLEIEDGQKVCIECGIILEQVIDEGAEWRSYDDTKEDNSRTGFTTSDLLPNSSYGSMISYKGISSTNLEMKSLQRLSTWSLSSNSDRSWIGIFEAINMACTFNRLPKSIIMDSCGLYKNQPEAQKVRGETRRSLMGAAVYVACRNNEASRTHEEIAKMFNVNIRTLCKAISLYTQSENTILQTQIGIAERLCVTLKLNEEQREKIFDTLTLISEKPEDEFENTPKTIVAGVVAYVLGLKTKNQMKTVSEASGVSALSIHKIVGKL
jgi:transcription initiation factor TFIIB